MNLKPFSIIFTIFMIIGIIATGLVLFSLFNKYTKTQQFEETEGEVVDIQEDTFKHSSTNHRGVSHTTTSILYAPVYEYEVDGKTYTCASNTYTNNYPVIGDTHTIHYNPENPEESYESLILNYYLFEIIMLVLCIGFTSTFTIATVICHKKIKAA